MLSALPQVTPVVTDPAAPSQKHSRRRTVARRLRKIVVRCALGYGALWLLAAGGTVAASAVARHQEAPAAADRTFDGIHHFERVDPHLWRGSAPSPEGYRALARMGIGTVVDLRAEKLSAHQLALPHEAGLKVVRMQIRDGQTPTDAQVTRFVQLVRTSKEPVFVHCGAGVGRTGSMVSAYMVRSGQQTPGHALASTLAVGPPSVEQLYYIADAGREHSDQPPSVVKVLSRILDAPRRINSSLHG